MEEGSYEPNVPLQMARIDDFHKDADQEKRPECQIFPMVPSSSAQVSRFIILRTTTSLKGSCER